jgi:hypothetical protein
MRSSVAGVIGGAVGILVGGLAVYTVIRSDQTKGMDTPPVCEARVSVARNPDTGKFEVTPKNVCLFVGHHLTWDVNTAVGDTVEIVFDEPDKAFAYDAGNADNTAPGKYKTTRPKPIRSNPALNNVGRWNYKVYWTPAEPPNSPRTEIDPAVCIRGG